MTFDPGRSAAIERLLQDTVTRTKLPTRRRRLAGVAAFALAGVLTGGSVSAFAAATSSPSPVPPPAVGTPLGGPLVQYLGDPTSLTDDENRTIELPSAPEDSTHLRLTFTCLTDGTFTFGFDSENNPSMVCDEASSSWIDFPLSTATGQLHVTTTVNGRYLASLQFIHKEDAPWGVNARGETYGVAHEDGTEPDLIGAYGVDGDGNQVLGYARPADLEQPVPSSPEEAANWEEIWDERFPDGMKVPIYDSDGETVIGTMTIGG